MKYFLLTAVVVVILIGGFIILNKSQTQNTAVQIQSSPIPSPSVATETNITASFTIKTGNITRSFKAEKYHNRSEDVYIEAKDPSLVHVKSAGITWDDFFKTLPMQLTKDCLTTGDGETYCSGKDGTLKFYVNDIEDPNLLEKPINQNDKALIIFSS